MINPTITLIWTIISHGSKQILLSVQEIPVNRPASEPNYSGFYSGYYGFYPLHYYFLLGSYAPRYTVFPDSGTFTFSLMQPILFSIP